MMKKPIKNKESLARLHNARFYKIVPRSIERMAYNEGLSKLAVARNDHSIEIWNFESCPFLETVIPKAPGISVEDLIWSGDRLFSVGITGFLVEWDLRTLKVKSKLYATGNSIWCIDRSPDGNRLAVGTEEGYITIYNIANGEMLYEKLLDKQSERVICLKFDKTGENIVGGSVGYIRIWNINSGRSTTKMTISRKFRHQDAFVWSLQVLSDFTVLSGDSRGYVTVWDGHMGAQIESHQVLKAAVLSIIVNKEENLFMCSGVEPVIKIYSKTLIKRDDSEYYCWVRCLQRRVHDHDIKSLVCIGDRIISGSVDGFLGLSSSSRGDPSIQKYGPFVKGPCMATAPEKRLVMVRYPTRCEIWRAGNSEKTASSEPLTEHNKETKNHQQNAENMDEKPSKNRIIEDYGSRSSLPLSSLPKKLLEIRTNDALIICAAISPNGKWLLYSTLYKVKLFQVTVDSTEKSNVQLKPFKKLPEELKDVVHMQFSSDSKRLFVVQAGTYDILIFDMQPLNSSEEFQLIETIHVQKHLSEPVTSLVVSSCSLYVAVGSLENKIGVWHALRGKTFEHLLNLPRYSVPATAIAFHPNRPLLVASYSDSKIVEYDLEARRFTCSETKYFVENANHHCVQNIVLDASSPNTIVLQNDSYLFSLEKILDEDKEDGPKPPERKVTRKSAANQIIHSSQESTSSEFSNRYCLQFKMEKSYEHLLHIASLGPKEIFALIVNLESLIQAMPPVLKEKKFGAA